MPADSSSVAIGRPLTHGPRCVATVKQCCIVACACSLCASAFAKHVEYTTVGQVVVVACTVVPTRQENSCPLCKKRFAKIGIYGVHGQLLRATHVEERDQDFDGEEAREDDMEDDDIVCRTCGSAADDEAMLLCDGRGGQCNDAYHYYCVGLAGIPEGDLSLGTCGGQLRDILVQGRPWRVGKWARLWGGGARGSGRRLRHRARIRRRIGATGALIAAV